MIRCYGQLQEWKKDGFDGHIILQVHDELVFSFPRRADPVKAPKQSNLFRIRKLMELMEQGGDDIGIPTPVSCKYHPETWAKGIAV